MEFLSIKYASAGAHGRVIGAEVVLDEKEETPEQAMEKLIRWVENQHKRVDTVIWDGL